MPIEEMKDAHFVVNFSGGKDSTAMLDYICETMPDVQKSAVFADTGWEHDDAEDWCRSLVARFGLPLHVTRNPNKDFFAMVRGRGKFPSPGQRQCTSDLKRGPIQTWTRQNIANPLIVNCMGLRAEESPNRARKVLLDRDASMTNSKRTVWTWLPILHWTEQQVLDYLREKNLPLHPVYSYLPRFSCQVCIYATKKDLHAIRVHNPQAFRKIADLEKEIGFTMQPGRTLTESADACEPKKPATFLADDFKTRPGLWHTKVKPKGEVKGVTDLPLFLGDKEKHEAKQAAAQVALL